MNFGFATRLFAAVGVSIAFAHSAVPRQEPLLAPSRTLDTHHRFEPPTDLATWLRRAESLRLRVRIAAGLEPEPLRTAVSLRSYATTDRDDYTVENVAFESLPGFFVTGNLYRPKGREPGTRSPGVLCPHGHWENGRLFERSLDDAEREIARGAEKGMAGARYPLQARCAQLARMGCVVLMYDMVGYADNQQLAHGAGFGDIESELHGLSAFGLQTWNSIRALDALESLPDVDGSRLGVTGASGGGTQTFVLAAIDERVKVAFPAVMVSSTMQGGCICENASHLRIGTDNVELAALAAPRPLALTGANDWTKSILEDGLPALKSVYSLFGAEENVQAWCYPQFDHNYNQVAREHMYAWFAKHLGLGMEEPIVEREFEPIAPEQLRVFHEQNPRPPGVDIATIRQALRATIEPRPLVAAMSGADPSIIAARMCTRLRVLLDSADIDRDRILCRETPLEMIGVRKRERWELTEESTGRVVSATYLEFGDGDERPLIVVGRDEEYLRSTLGLGESFAIGDSIVVVDPCRAEDGAFVACDENRHRDYVGYTSCYNRVVQAERVHDVAIVSGYVERRWKGAAGYVGLDDGAWTLLLARATAPVRDLRSPVFLDLRNALRPIESFADERLVPGIARLGRPESLLALLAPLRVEVVTGVAIPVEVLGAFRRLSEMPTPETDNLSVIPPERFEQAIASFPRSARVAPK